MLLHGGRALRPGAAQVEPTDILIDSDRIVEVGARLARPSDVEAVDTRGFLILPGLINAHTHGHGHLLRGLAGRWTLEELRARAQEAADRARSRNAAAWQLAAQLAPYIATACRAAVATPYPVNRYAAPLADAPR
jgi:guanine deaminase